MPFPEDERRALLNVAGVGPTVVTRLQQLGFHSLAQLSQARAADILACAASLTASTCWKNSPQARAAIESAIALAQSHQGAREEAQKAARGEPREGGPS